MEKARSAYEALDQQQKEQIPQALVKVLEKAEEGWKREDYGQIREEKDRCKSEGEMRFQKATAGKDPRRLFLPEGTSVIRNSCYTDRNWTYVQPGSTCDQRVERGYM